MDRETLTFLLRGGHPSMPDRIERGLWPHPPMKLSEVASSLASILREDRWFPREWHPHTQGQPVHEGGVIERMDSTRYIYRTARSWPSNSFVTADVTEKIFSNPKDAGYHLKWDLCLPGELDGWKVIE